MNAFSDLFALARKIRTEDGRLLVHFTNRRARLVFLDFPASIELRAANSALKQRLMQAGQVDLPLLVVHQGPPLRNNAKGPSETSQIAFIADPERRLYRAFQIPHLPWPQLWHPRRLVRALLAIAAPRGARIELSALAQLGAHFIVERNEIVQVDWQRDLSPPLEPKRLGRELEAHHSQNQDLEIAQGGAA